MTFCVAERINYDSSYLDSQDLHILNLFNEFTSLDLCKDYERFDELGEIFSEMEWEQGGFSITYRMKSPYIIKQFVEDMYGRNSDFYNDQNILKKIHTIACYPKLVAYIENKFMVTEFIEGKMMYQLNDDDLKNIPYEKWVNFIYHLVETIEFGYLPQDLHSGNIMIDSNYDIKIIDVGAYTPYSFGETINIQKFLLDDKFEFLKPLYCFIMEQECELTIDFNFKENVDLLFNEDDEDYWN